MRDSWKKRLAVERKVPWKYSFLCDCFHCPWASIEFLCLSEIELVNSFVVCDFVRTLGTRTASRDTLPQKAPNSWNKVDSECNKPLCSDVAGVQRILDPT